MTDKMQSTDITPAEFIIDENGSKSGQIKAELELQVELAQAGDVISGICTNGTRLGKYANQLRAALAPVPVSRARVV